MIDSIIGLACAVTHVGLDYLNAIASICLSFFPLRVRDRGENDLPWQQHRHWQGNVWTQQWHSGGKQGGLRKT